VCTAYPTALDECYDVYKWVLAGRLGFHPSSVVLAGDSNGANLAVATAIRAIQERSASLAVPSRASADSAVRVPDALVLGYPILNMRAMPTPSRSAPPFLFQKAA
jgi:hormone-sensitive lipase